MKTSRREWLIQGDLIDVKALLRPSGLIYFLESERGDLIGNWFIREDGSLLIGSKSVMQMLFL